MSLRELEWHYFIFSHFLSIDPDFKCLVCIYWESLVCSYTIMLIRSSSLFLLLMFSSSFFNLKGDYTENEISACICKPKIYCFGEFFFLVENRFCTFSQPLDSFYEQLFWSVQMWCCFHCCSCVLRCLLCSICEWLHIKYAKVSFLEVLLGLCIEKGIKYKKLLTRIKCSERWDALLTSSLFTY